MTTLVVVLVSALSLAVVMATLFALALKIAHDQIDYLMDYDEQTDNDYWTYLVGANKQKAGWRDKARRRKTEIARLERKLLLADQQLHWMSTIYERVVSAIHERHVLKTEGAVLEELSVAMRLLDAVRRGDAKLSVPIGEIELSIEEGAPTSTASAPSG